MTEKEMEELAKDLNTELVNEEIIESPIDLLHKLALAEENYRQEESFYTNEYNKQLIDTDWNSLNNERVEKGLSKLSNQDMKKAYIENQLYLARQDLVLAKMEYNRLFRMYEMMKKYSLDILR